MESIFYKYNNIFIQAYYIYIRNLFKDTWNKLAVTMEESEGAEHILFT